MAQKKVTASFNGGDAITALGDLVLQIHDASDDSIIATANYAAIGSYNTQGTDSANIVYTLNPTGGDGGNGEIILDGVDVGSVTSIKIRCKDESGNESILSSAVSTATDWTLDGASYDSVSRDVSGIDTNPSGIFFKPDGTIMYLLGNTSNKVSQIDLSPAWDVTSGTVGNELSMSGVFQGLWFSDDGLAVFSLNATGSPRPVNKHVLTVAWDLSTAGGVNSTYSVTTFTVARSCSFSGDGTIMYVSGDAKIEAYDLSTAWDITTAGASPDKTLDLSAITAVRNVYFQDDGLKAFIVDNANTIYGYDLSVAWDISTGTSSGNSLDVSSQATVPLGLFIKPDGAKLYITGLSNSDIYQYSMG